MATVTPTAEPTRLRRDAADNHRRLLEAAVGEFNEQGMDACVEQIAARAGVGIGTFYRRFGTKDALVERLVDDLLIELAESAHRSIAAGDSAGLEQFLREVATALAHHRGILARVWSDNRTAHSARLRPLVLQLLATAQGLGAIRPEITGNDLSVLMWSMRGSPANVTSTSRWPACARTPSHCATRR